MCYKRILESTNKSFHKNTSHHIKKRICLINKIITERPTSIEMLLGFKLTIVNNKDLNIIYNYKDLKYDIKQGYFKLGDTIGCNICHTKDTELFCLHRYLCIDCAGGGILRCGICNPLDKLYIVDYDSKYIPIICFN